MKTLVVYYSFSGNNELLAREIRARLGCEIYKVSEIKNRGAFTIFLDVFFNRSPKIHKPNISLKQYDHIILIAPIWSGRIASPLKAFLKLEKDYLKEYSFITLCGGGGNKNISKELTKLIQKKPLAVKELTLNDILPAEKKNRINYTSGYRVNKQDLKAFQKGIDSFIKNRLHALTPQS